MGANTTKSVFLGENISTAQHRLRKQLLFHYVSKAGDAICFKCGTLIENVDDLSIEHKLPWLHNSPELFWDLDNIAFSHLTCNKTHTFPRLRKIGPEGTRWCAGHKEFHTRQDFGVDNRNWTGLKPLCKLYEQGKGKGKRKQK